MTPQYTEGADPVIDGSIWSTAFRRLGLFFTSALNEFGFSIQVSVQNDGGTVTAPYEKAAQIIEIDQHAPSDYAKGVTKDVVALDRRASIKAGNKTGRAWGGFDLAAVDRGAEGIAVACEVCIKNEGSNQPQVDTIDMKIGHLYTHDGDSPATAIAYVPGEMDRPAFNHGWILRQNAFAPGGKVFDLRKTSSNDSLFSIDRDGAVTLQGREVVVKSVQLASGQTMDVLTLK